MENMSEENLNGPSQIQRPSQYPTATRIENGNAYDISGKVLGSVGGMAAQSDEIQGVPPGLIAEPIKDDAFFASLVGKPVEGLPPVLIEEPIKDDAFFQKLGGKPVGGAIPQTQLTQQQLEQRAYETAGGTTVGDTTKEILGHINEAASQGLGRNAPEMWSNIKGTVKKHFGPNATDDVITGITNWIGNQIDEQYGDHGAVARYSPDTDLGKRAIAMLPMMGPALASVIRNLENKEYSQAALTTGKIGVQMGVQMGVMARLPAIDAVGAGVAVGWKSIKPLSVTPAKLTFVQRVWRWIADLFR